MDLTPDGKDSATLCLTNAMLLLERAHFGVIEHLRLLFKLGPSDLNEYGTLGPQATGHRS